MNSARAPVLRFAILCTCIAACDRGEPAVFGRACVDDSQCDVEGGLVCDVERHQCAPPRPPEPIPGLTCDDAHDLELRAVGGLFTGTLDVELGPDPSPSSTGAACAGDAARWVYVRIDVPTAMAARVVATGQGKVSVAVLDEQCAPHLDHACAAGNEVVLPLVEGTVTVAVSASTGARVSLGFEQVLCPAGFVPTGTGCLGFLELEDGPKPREGHQLTVVDAENAVVSGGIGEDGTPVVSQIFSRRVLSWQDLQNGTAREGHAAAATDGFLFVVGGNASSSGELLEPDTTRFFPQPEPEEARGVSGGTLTHISTDSPMVFVGGSEPVSAFFFEPSTTCTDGFDCPASFECIALVDDNDFGDVHGLCLCVADDCNRLLQENPSWIDLQSPPDLRFRQRHVAVDIDVDPDNALVVVTGGYVNEPDVGGEPEPASFILFGDSLTWVQLPVEPVARRDGLGAALGGGDLILVGGRDAGEAPLDAIEIWTPLLVSAPRVTHLARPRADIAGGLIGAPATVGAVGSAFIVIGGDDGAGPLATTELIDVVTGVARVGPALPFPLSGARAALLEDGDLLVAGGRTEGGALVQTALLLTEIAPTLVKPDVGQGFVAPEIEGDFCEEAVALAGASGSVEGNTIGFQNDLDVLNDPSCNGVSSSPGFDAFFRLDVPAGSLLDLTLFDPIGASDLVLVVYDACPLEEPCVDGADSQVDRAEELTVAVAGAQTLFIVVDGYRDDAPFNYRLDWAVSPQ